MKESNIVIFSEDEDYSFKWGKYIETANIPFEVIIFTEEKQLKKFYEENQIDILISTEENEEDIKDISSKMKIILYESLNKKKNAADIIYINKFQSAGTILSTIIKKSTEEKKSFILNRENEKKIKIVGIYSPVNRCLKTLFSIILSVLYSEKEPTLYLNFEEYSSLNEIFQTGHPGNLSDLIFYLKQNKKYFAMQLLSVVNRCGELDYILPVKNKEDLKELKVNEWKILLEEISKATNYNNIILDLGNSLNNITDIIEYCDVVFMPERDDKISIAKINDFENYFSEKDKKIIKNKIIRINLMEFENRNTGCDIEHLKNSEMGIKIRKNFEEYMRSDKWIMSN